MSLANMASGELLSLRTTSGNYATVESCIGDPNSQLARPVGSLALRTDGVNGAVLYIKQTGGSTDLGWESFAGPIILVAGYGDLPPSPNNLVLGAGGAGPNAASIAFGDGTGWLLNFINDSGTILLSLSDTGDLTITHNLIVNNAAFIGFTSAAAGEKFRAQSARIDGLTATRPVRSDGNKLLISGQIDLTNANDIKGTGLGANDILKWNSSGNAVAGVAGISSGQVSEITSSSVENVVQTVALSGIVPAGLTLTVTYVNINNLNGIQHNVTDGVVVT